MSLWRQLRYGLRALKNRASREQDVADELAQFFEAAEAEWRQRGLSFEEARKAARSEAGSMVLARDQASEYGWENGVRIFFDDLQFALRQLWTHPSFTATAVLTLALGIGANTAVFTVVERVLLAPLPYKNAARLAVLETREGSTEKTIPRVTGPDAVDVRDQAQTLDAVSLYSGGSLGVQLKDHAAYTIVTIADENFAQVFGLLPVAGRLYTNADAGHAAMVSRRFAVDNFGTAQDALGQVMRVEGEPREIVGVLGQGFDFPNGTQVWMASARDPESKSRTAFNYRAVARLRGDASFILAGTELRTISSRLGATYPKENGTKQLIATPLGEALTGDLRPTLMFLWASAGLISLIACVNVMHLELVRSMERKRELAIRTALGSSRWRVMQPVFLETVLVAVIGGAAGLLLALPTVWGLVAMAPQELPRLNDVHLNWRVLGFALGLSIVTAILSALLPAMRAAKVHPAEALKSDSSRGMEHRSSGLFRDGLVVVEVAAAFVLAVGAALLLQTMMTLNTRGMGYETRQLLVVDADAPAVGESDSRRAVSNFSVLFAKLRELPGVEAVAGVMGLPTGIYGSNGSYETKGGLQADFEHPASSNFSVASLGYFSTMRIPLKKGRDFGSEDTKDSAMVAVISESLEHHSFGDGDAIGKQIRCGLDSDKWMTIVGVVGDVRQGSPAEKPGATLYMPMTQHPFYANQIHVVLRTHVPPLTLMNAADAKIAGVDPRIARRYTTMDAMVGDSISTEKFRAALLSLFAGLGLLLAILGVYGTVAYSVAQRRFEFGVRMAFGAERGAILRSVLGYAIKMAGLGIVIGLVSTLALTRLISSMLLGVKSTDPVSLGFVSGVLLITALGAAWVPGRSATRVSPMVALRG